MEPKFALPGIRTIEYVNADKLPNDLTLMRQARMPIIIYTQRTPIPFAGEPTCETESANENKGKRQTVTLSFQSTITLPEEFPLAFVVTDQTGQTWLVGLPEEPYPLVTSVQTFGQPEGDIHALNVEVSFTAPEALIPVSIA
ncbi:MAG: hypothetical protein KBS70_07665 [Bacteroidales bacterium]|nr:hypothetical protein [Candidatus Colicola caccequi]MBQ0154643.1 hypothetical protein [Candidatus Colicola equi]